MPNLSEASHEVPSPTEGVDGFYEAQDRGSAITLYPEASIPIRLRLYSPPTTKGHKNMVIVAPATGVPQRTYRRFAKHLASKGFTVVSLDYRGIAESKPRTLKGFHAGLPHWGMDLACVIRWAEANYPGSQMSLVGHSIGGFLPLISDDCTRLHRLVTVGAQTAYWKDWPALKRLPLFMIWHVLMPATTGLLGYFPGQRLGLGEDLPYEVASGWGRRWKNPGILHQMPPDYVPVPVKAPILAIHSTDDDFATQAAIQRMHRGYTQATVQYRPIRPREYGQKSIGHFGYFKPGMEALWDQVCDWLQSD